MKIAGLKNDGAWYRVNKLLKKLRADPLQTDQIYELSSAIYASENQPTVDAAFAAMNAIAARCGITPPASPANASAWIARLVEVGIPRQIWNGRLSFTTYSREFEGETVRFVADAQSEFHALGKIVRKQSSLWMHARRAINDLTGTGSIYDNNPGWCFLYLRSIDTFLLPSPPEAPMPASETNP